MLKKISPEPISPENFLSCLIFKYIQLSMTWNFCKGIKTPLDNNTDLNTVFQLNAQFAGTAHLQARLC